MFVRNMLAILSAAFLLSAGVASSQQPDIRVSTEEDGGTPSFRIHVGPESGQFYDAKLVPSNASGYPNRDGNVLTNDRVAPLRPYLQATQVNFDDELPPEPTPEANGYLMPEETVFKEPKYSSCECN